MKNSTADREANKDLEPSDLFLVRVINGIETEQLELEAGAGALGIPSIETLEAPNSRRRR